jgi:hypothetical protein
MLLLLLLLMLLLLLSTFGSAVLEPNLKDGALQGTVKAHITFYVKEEILNKV